MKKIQKIILICIFFFSSICLADQSENLQKLKDLYDDNILTEDQYNEAKEKILERMAINNVNKTGIEGLSGGEFDPQPGDPPPGPCENLFPGQTCGVYTTESFLSSHGLKTKDLSPMLLELGKKTQATVPACTTDFCFTMQPEYAKDEIINKAALINALYRHNPDIIATLNYTVKNNEGEIVKDPKYLNRKKGYCSEKYGCFQVMTRYTYEYDQKEKIMKTKWLVDGLFPEEVDPDCIGDCYNKVRAYDQGEGNIPMTPDDWLEDNGLTEEDLVNMVKDYPSTYKFEGDKLKTIDLNVEYSLTDEITNTDQLLKSLLFWQPQLIGENAYAYWISKDEFVVAPNALVIEGVLGRKVVYKSSIQDPPIVKQIRAGWKVLEGTHMLVINDEDPYWQTEEGLIERPPKIDTGIEYAPETVPGADPKIVPDLTPEQDKPPSDPNPPPKLDDPSVLQPVDPG